MAQSNILAVNKTGGQSTDVVVTATTPATVSAYTTDAGGLVNDFQMSIVQKMPGGGYQQFYREYKKPLILSVECSSHVLTAPGTYAVQKGANTAQNLGVALDQ